jgi:cytochrome c biogenesis protein CcdA
MVETVTPAVCGSRRRQLAALALFTAGAVLAAASLGAVLGLAGAAIGTGPALAVALALAVLGALREAGIVRFPIPQSRRQVPERWRSELPLPVWSAGYGAGLGLGFLTYQPVATFWVACAAALALGRPLGGALAFAAYGVGRAAVLLLPVRRGADAAAIAERLASRRRALLRANAVALGVCACLLAAAPVAGAEVVPLGPGSQMDPSAAATGFAYTARAGGTSEVVVRPADGGEPVVFPDAHSPSLYRGRLAYEDAQGVRVVAWRTGDEIVRLDGQLEKPGLGGPWLVYRKYFGHRVPRANRPEHAGHERYALYLYNIPERTTRRLASGVDGVEIGRPSIHGDLIAWHVVGGQGSRIVLYRISTGTRTYPFRTKRWLLANPALTGRRIVWTRDVPSGSTLLTRRIRGGAVRGLASVSRPRTDYWFWTTELHAGVAYVTRWNTRRGIARILRAGV